MTDKERAFMRRCRMLATRLMNVWENNHDKKGINREFMLKVVVEAREDVELMREIMNRKEQES